MDLNFDTNLIASYHSHTQIARILTESWVLNNMFCPRCGNLHIKKFPNNRPVADFFCPNCLSEYELKSKNGPLGSKITDGAYSTMIERITSNTNPDFLFLCYSKKEMNVKDFIFVPKYFFVPEIIEKRKTLSQNARRAGWVGCNILLNKIPSQGRIPIINKSSINQIENVVKMVSTANLLDIKNIKSRSWLMDILTCINQIPKDIFSLDEIYFFEKFLSQKHPQNRFIKAKIRQQLQILRDNGFLLFLGKGKYKKLRSVINEKIQCNN